MHPFFAELKRRQIYRVAAAYAVVAWVLLQLVNNVTPFLRLPVWAGTLILVLLVVGFPIALLFAWIQQLAPEDGTIGRVATGKADWALVGALLAVVGLFAYQQFAPAHRAATQQAGVIDARATPVSPKGAVSLAVLPFVNLSSDKEQEFFSDGMTEEITTALAKVPDLRVVGRTSAFQFKGNNKDLRAIGKALGARYLIEGSVRKEGNQVRITAQLINVEDGTNLWGESYNRELKGVFAVQEQIAQSIAVSLRAPLGLKEGDSLVPSRTADLDSYQDYLRARALIKRRGTREPGGPLTQAAVLLESVVARDPQYAPAWALLAQVYGFIAAYGSPFSRSDEQLHGIIDAWLPKGEAAAQEAVRLDPNSVAAYTSLASVQNFRGRLRDAANSYDLALRIDPSNTDVLHLYSLLLGGVGQVKEAIKLRRRLQALDPLVDVFNAFTANFLWLGRENEAAVEIFRTIPSDNPFAARQLALLHGTEGKYAEAADDLRKASRSYDPEIVKEGSALLDRAGKLLPTSRNPPDLGSFSVLYVFSDMPDRALDSFEANLKARFWVAADAPQFWHPAFTTLRKTERFKRLMRSAGLVDYWRERGWPDLCHPIGTDDFACE